MTRSLALLLPLTLLACSSDDDEGTTEPSVEADLTVAPGPLPGIVEVTVTTSEDAIVELEHGLEDTLTTHPVLSNGGTEHRFTVLGLKAGVDYLFEALGDRASIEVGPTSLRAARLDPRHVEHIGDEREQVPPRAPHPRHAFGGRSVERLAVSVLLQEDLGARGPAVESQTIAAP